MIYVIGENDMSHLCGFVDLDSSLPSDATQRILRQMLASENQKISSRATTWIDGGVALAIKIWQNHPQYDGFCLSSPIRRCCLVDGAFYPDIRNTVQTGNNSQTSFAEQLSEKYDQSGERAFPQLDGEFAAILWDAQEKKLYLIKDRFGTKPLYYYVSSRFVLFASDLESMMRSHLFAVEANLPGITDFLSYGYIPHPETQVKNVSQLDPGSYVCIDTRTRQIKLTSYWTFHFKNEALKSEESYLEEFSDLFEKAIRKRIRTDLAFGSYLSGGVDSSAVCAILSRLTPKAPAAFSIGFKESAFNELDYARLVAERCKLDWHYEYVSASDMLNLYETMVKIAGAPFTDTSLFPSFFGAQQASASVQIVLTGDGSDQLLAGSEHHGEFMKCIESGNGWHSLINRRFFTKLYTAIPFGMLSENLWCKILRRIYSQSLNLKEAIYEPMIFRFLLKKCLYSYDLWKVDESFPAQRNIVQLLKNSPKQDLMEQLLLRDINFYLHDDLLPKVERTCTFNGVEYRTPFLDKDLCDFIEWLPLALRINQGEKKYLVKKAMQEHLPHTVLYRKKQGFAIPQDSWYHHEAQSFIRGVLLDKRCLERGYFKPKAIEKLVNDYFADKTSYYTGSSHMITALVSLELWHQLFIDTKHWETVKAPGICAA
jgi:asparagine synthase (glutamine-hydrolysing)